MNIQVYTHWGKDSYRSKLPHTENEALLKYLKAARNKPRTPASSEGTNGVTIFRKPLMVLGLVRGLDEVGNSTFFVVVDDDQ